jgi:hypothetical protein
MNGAWQLARGVVESGIGRLDSVLAVKNKQKVKYHFYYFSRGFPV